jgi:hypothetical protein
MTDYFSFDPVAGARDVGFAAPGAVAGYGARRGCVPNGRSYHDGSNSHDLHGGERNPGRSLRELFRSIAISLSCPATPH